MPILKLKEHDEEKEIEFEINYLLSLSLQQRFEMMEEKNSFIRSFIKQNEHRKTTQIIKRARS